MLHRGHVALGSRIEDIADEQVAGRATVGQERGAPTVQLIAVNRLFRHFTHHTEIFVISPTQSRGFVISHTGTAFVISHTAFRHFTHHLSSFHPPAISDLAVLSMRCRMLSTA